MSNWACNTCADSWPDEYPADCKVVRAPAGKVLFCEICGGEEKSLNVPVDEEISCDE